MQLIKEDLNSWEICNPDNAEDPLPMPYRLIDQVLQETILYKLNLSLHEIESKKKDKNYEGGIRQYISQSTMDIEGISCMSTSPKTHNHLLAGDKAGTVYLLDPAKKAIFSKKQVCANRRVSKINQSSITDGETMITLLTVICNNNPSVYVLSYKHSEPKLFMIAEIIVCDDQNNVNKYPYECQIEDSGRLILVKTYEGTILCYKLPELTIDTQSHLKNNSTQIPQQQIKKILKYPLKMVTYQLEPKKIKQIKLQIKFKGVKIPPKYNQLVQKLKKKKEPIIQQEVKKKDDKKKDDKKPIENIQQVEEVKKLQFNETLQYKEISTYNGLDNTSSYDIPKFLPFVYILNGSYLLPKNKYFEKGTHVQIAQKIIYGWTNTNQIYCGEIRQINLQHIPTYLHIAYFESLPSKEVIEKKQSEQKSMIEIKNLKSFSNLYPICSVDLSNIDQIFLGCGLKDGTVAIWNTGTWNLQMTTNKHEQSVTALKFFQSWKVISGSQKGSIHVDNIVNNQNEVKRTNTFQSKVNLPITNLEVNELGIAIALDSGGNLRAYDLWRNQKISRIHPCTAFALLEGKGKRWLSSLKIFPNETVYTNRDFTIILSTNWPNFPVRQQDATIQQIQKLATYKKNPWLCPGTNIHIIRNFQFLLNHFQGLESTYKKGYERKKIQNLFTNLQFSQLYDRNFDIPDFGRTTGLKKTPKNKDSNFGASSFSKTKLSQRSKSKNSLQQEVSQAKLTSEILHPQKFLLERRKIDKRDIVTEETLAENLRKQHQKKQRRESILTSQMSKNML